MRHVLVHRVKLLLYGVIFYNPEAAYVEISAPTLSDRPKECSETGRWSTAAHIARI